MEHLDCMKEVFSESMATNNEVTDTDTTDTITNNEEIVIKMELDNFFPVEETEVLLSPHSSEKVYVTDSEEIYIRLSNNKPGQRSWDKLKYCLFCKKPFTNISKHLLSKHKDKTIIHTILLLPKNHPNRKLLLESLNNRGNYLHNCQVLKEGRGEIIPWKCPPFYIHYSEFVPCLHCFGFFLQKKLLKHHQMCLPKRKIELNYYKSLGIETDLDLPAMPHIELKNKTKKKYTKRKPNDKIYPLEVDMMLHPGGDLNEDRLSHNHNPHSNEVASEFPDSIARNIEGTDTTDAILNNEEMVVKMELDNFFPVEETEVLLSPNSSEKVNVTGEKIYIRLSNNKPGHRTWDKVKYCVFCKKPTLNIAKHHLSKHKDKHIIQTVSSLPKNDSKRKLLLESLNNRGNYLHNCQVLKEGRGEIIPWKCPSFYMHHSKFVHCKLCFGFFVKRELCKHKKLCLHKRQIELNYLKSVGIATDLDLPVMPRLELQNKTKRKYTRRKPKDKVYPLDADMMLHPGAEFNEERVSHHPENNEVVREQIHPAESTFTTPEMLLEDLSAEKLPRKEGKGIKEMSSFFEDLFSNDNALWTVFLQADLKVEANRRKKGEAGPSKEETFSTNQVLKTSSTQRILKVLPTLAEKMSDSAFVESGSSVNTLEERKSSDRPLEMTDTFSALLDTAVSDLNASSVDPPSPADAIYVRLSNNKPGGQRSWDKAKYCAFCRKPFTNISKHLFSQHKDQNIIQVILSVPKNNPRRKLLLEAINNRGNYIHNCRVLKEGRGEIIPWRCPPSYVHYSEFAPCQHCFGFFQKKELRKHTERCIHQKRIEDTDNLEMSVSSCS